MLKHKLIVALAFIAVSMLSYSTSASAWVDHHCCCHRCYVPRGMTAADLVRARINANPQLAGQPITVASYEGDSRKVILSGYADSVWQKHAVIDVARYTCGVHMVIDAVIEQ